VADDCDRKPVTRDMCHRHYQSWLRLMRTPEQIEHDREQDRQYHANRRPPRKKET
jgi:hypothetical protein